MINWKKRVLNFKDNNIEPGDDVAAVAFLQPAGALTEATSRASLGLVGMLLAKKLTSAKKNENEIRSSVMSKNFPDGVVIVAVTEKGRIMVYEHSAISGKPRRFIKEYNMGDFKVESIKKGALKSDVTVAFKDGGTRIFEAGKGQDLDEFASSL